MRPYLQIDFRSWWVGFYVNTPRREFHLCILFIVFTLALPRPITEEVEF